MKKILLILATAAAMSFAQNPFLHGMAIGLGVVSADGSGSDLYDRTGDVGIGLRFGWNFLFPISESVSFHTGTDFNYQYFSENDGDESYSYNRWLEMWQTGLLIPLAVRSTWKDLYMELGARFTLKLGSGWATYYGDDEKDDSGSLDDVYKRYHIGMMMAVGLRFNEIDFNITTAYDLTSVTKDYGNGGTKNLTIDFIMIVWFGGQK